MSNGATGCARSSGHRLAIVLLFAMIAATVANVAWAQPVEGPPTHAEVERFLGPMISMIIWPFHVLALAWWYITKNPSAAVLLSALSAGIFAWLSMRNQALTSRLRETFNTVNRDNWDEDVIKAREALTNVKRELAASPGLISQYAHNTIKNGTPTEEQVKKFISVRTTLQTILNDYENVALGIKHGIMDELFLYQWMRTTVIDDWETLSPLVDEYRRVQNNPQLYVEFEGLAAEWKHNRSYNNNRRRLNRSRRWLRIR